MRAEWTFGFAGLFHKRFLGKELGRFCVFWKIEDFCAFLNVFESFWPFFEKSVGKVGVLRGGN